MKNAEVVVEDEVDFDKINVGCKVKVFDITFDEEMEFNIVGSTEANSLEGKISNESPVGQALMGKKVGEDCRCRDAGRRDPVQSIGHQPFYVGETRPLSYKGSSFAFREYKKCTRCQKRKEKISCPNSRKKHSRNQI